MDFKKYFLQALDAIRCRENPSSSYEQSLANFAERTLSKMPSISEAQIKQMAQQGKPEELIALRLAAELAEKEHTPMLGQALKGQIQQRLGEMQKAIPTRVASVVAEEQKVQAVSPVVAPIPVTSPPAAPSGPSLGSK